MSTSAGSLALNGVRATRDAFVAERLRAAGAVILGKTNLSEWANMRSTHSVSGWSGRGGQTRNPFALDRNPSGSSSGSGAAIAASLATLAVGTETDGSIVSPASSCGIVGIKPTLGLVSRSGIIPIAHSQDTAGPMTRSVADAALMLAAMTGFDNDDAVTKESQGKVGDYAAALRLDGLRGKRIGVARNFFGGSTAIDEIVEQELAVLKAQGAILVDVKVPNTDKYGDSETEVLLYEFKPDLAAYLAGYAPHAAIKNMADVIAFNDKHAAREMPYFGQEHLIASQAKEGSRRQGLPRGAGQQPALFARGGDRQDPARGKARRAGGADRRPGLADRLHQWRPLRDELLVAGGRGRLPAHHGAGRLRAWAAGGDLVCRRRLERGDPDRDGLRLRASQQAAPYAGFPGHGQYQGLNISCVWRARRRGPIADAPLRRTSSVKSGSIFRARSNACSHCFGREVTQ